MSTAPRPQPRARQQRLERIDRREFRQILAAIVFHAAPPDVEPSERNSFVCDCCSECGEPSEDCTCANVCSECECFPCQCDGGL